MSGRSKGDTDGRSDRGEEGLGQEHRGGWLPPLIIPTRRVEAIHFKPRFGLRSVSLRRANHQPEPRCRSDRIDKDNAWCALFCARKQIANARQRQQTFQQTPNPKRDVCFASHSAIGFFCSGGPIRRTPLGILAQTSDKFLGFSKTQRVP